MADTATLTLPLLEAAQSQKHVTMNAALVRLDAACQMVLMSISTATPPGFNNDGDCYGVPTGATGDWAGQAGRVAVHSNGGWTYLDPASGWRAWVGDTGRLATYEDGAWVEPILCRRITPT